MARAFTLALAASLLAGGAAAQDDPIGDLLGGPSISPAEAPPAPAPEAAAPAEAAAPSAAPAQPTSAPTVPAAPQPELDEEGKVMPPPTPSASTPTPPPPAVATPESQPAPPAQAAAPTAPEAPQPPPTAALPAPETQPVAPPAATPPPAPAPSAPVQAATPPAPQPAQAATPPPRPAAPQPYPAPPAQTYAAPAPSQAAPPVASLPTGPIPYQALTPSPAPPMATMAPPTYAPTAPYAQPAPSYAAPSYASPTPPPTAYSSPPMGLASAPPPSTGVQTGARSPVHIDEHGRTPDAAPTYRELDYEQRLRSSYASAQGLQGPLDGGWTLAVDGDDRYFLQLVERSSGLLEGVWRDLRRTGALNASGFVEGLQRYGGQLTFSFRPDGRDELATATLTAGADGKWSGELVRGRDRKTVTLRRN